MFSVQIYVHTCVLKCLHKSWYAGSNKHFFIDDYVWERYHEEPTHLSGNRKSVLPKAMSETKRSGQGGPCGQAIHWLQPAHWPAWQVANNISFVYLKCGMTAHELEYQRLESELKIPEMMQGNISKLHKDYFCKQE